MAHWIFGYGSLVDLANLQQYLGRAFKPDEVRFCRLRGYRRCWNVAMDNRQNLTGYKYYIDPDTDRRPDIFVTFLNIRPVSNSSIDGILFALQPDELPVLDQRERNYRRIEITRRLEPPLRAAIRVPAWSYIGRAEAEQRYQAGVRQGTAVIQHAYFENVRDAFATLGKASQFAATTDPPTVPIRPLQRVNLPAD